MKERILFLVISLVQWIRKNSVVLLPIFFLGIIADVFMLPTSSDLRIASILLIYWLYVRLKKIKSHFTIGVTFILLLFMFLSFVITGTSVRTERLAVWVVLFLGFGIIQQWREVK